MGMSALGQKQTFRTAMAMSALHLIATVKADITLGYASACDPVLRTERRHRVRVPPANASSQHPPQQSPRVVLTPEIVALVRVVLVHPARWRLPRLQAECPALAAVGGELRHLPLRRGPQLRVRSARACSGCGARSSSLASELRRRSSGVPRHRVVRRRQRHPGPARGRLRVHPRLRREPEASCQSCLQTGGALPHHDELRVLGQRLGAPWEAAVACTYETRSGTSLGTKWSARHEATISLKSFASAADRPGGGCTRFALETTFMGKFGLL